MAKLFTVEQAKNYLLTNGYKNVQLLGEGGFCIVFKATNSGNDTVAVKVISDTNSANMDKELAAVNTMKALKKGVPASDWLTELKNATQAYREYKDNFVNPSRTDVKVRKISAKELNEVYEASQKKESIEKWKADEENISKKDEEGNVIEYKARTILLESELLENTKEDENLNLQKVVEQTKNAINQLGNAIKTMHNRNIAHMDIKMDNIVKSGKRYRLLDYGSTISGSKPIKIPEATGKHLVKIPGFPHDYQKKAPSIEQLKQLDMYFFGRTVMEIFARLYNKAGVNDEKKFDVPGPGQKCYDDASLRTQLQKLKQLCVKHQELNGIFNFIQHATNLDPSSRKLVKLT